MYLEPTKPYLQPYEVVELWRERSRVDGKAKENMGKVTDAYNGDIKSALTELYEDEEPAVTNLIYQGVNHMALRIASPNPVIQTWPVDSGKKKSITRADTRRRAYYGMWEYNDMYAVLIQRSMWLMGFASAPCTIAPDKKLGGPKWSPRDPRFFWPADNSMNPDNYIAQTAVPFGVLRRKYGDARFATLNKNTDYLDTDGWKDSDMVTVLEYSDATVTMMLAIGTIPDETYGHSDMNLSTDQMCVVLELYPNYCQAPLVSNPQAIVLDPATPRSQFMGLLGSYQARTRLMALSYIAVKKGVLPSWWAVGADEEPIVHEVPDPKRGTIGKVSLGSLVKEDVAPQFASTQIMDRLEESERGTASIPSEYGGLSPTNIRTGKRGGQVMSATVDPYIEFAQMRFARSLQLENEMASEVERTFFSGKRSFYINWKNAKGPIEYTPSELWDTTKNKVNYPFAGLDLSNITIEALQLVGADAMSIDTLMDLHPLIEDTEEQKQKIVVGQVDRAAMAAFQAQAADPAGPFSPKDIAELKQMILSGKSWEEAIIELDRKKQEENAGMTDDPMAGVPGLEAGAQAGVPSIGTPDEQIPGVANLGRMMLSTRQPNMGVSPRPGAV